MKNVATGDSKGCIHLRNTCNMDVDFEINANRYVLIVDFKLKNKSGFH